jgi:hypothetical protein
MIPNSGNRFPAFAKPASAGEGRSEKITLKRTSPRQAAEFVLRAMMALASNAGARSSASEKTASASCS